MDKLKLYAIIGGILLIPLCCVLSMVFMTNTKNNAVDTLNAVNLGKALGVMDHQASVMDHLVTSVNIYTVAIGLICLAFAFVVYKVVMKLGGGHGRAGGSGAGYIPDVQLSSARSAGNWISLDPGRAMGYINGLDRGSKANLLDQLYYIVAFLERELGIYNQQHTQLLSASKPGRKLSIFKRNNNTIDWG